MNITIQQLTLILLTSCFAISHQNFIIRNSQLSYSFNHFLYGSNVDKFKVYKTTFSNFLSTPIILNNAGTHYSFEYFTETQSYTSCAEYEFISNVFSKCISDNKGGGIYISCSTNQKLLSGSTVTLKSNCFTQCQSNQGGAFYIISDDALCQENTFRDCHGGYFSIFNLDTKSQAVFEYNHIINTKNPEKSRQHSAAVTSQRMASAKNLNVSSNKLDSSHDILLVSIPSEGLRTDIRYLNFFNGTSQSIFFVKSLSSTVVENINFVGNKASKYLIDIGSFQLKIRDSSFIEDQSPVLSSRYVEYINCNFDQYRNQVSFSAYFTVTNCAFHESKTQKFVLKTEPNCEKPTITDSPSDQDDNKKLSTGSISVISILAIGTVVCLVVMAFYVVKKKMCSKKNDQIPLMYV